MSDIPVLLGDDVRALYGLASSLLGCAQAAITDAVTISGGPLTDADVPTSVAVHPRVPDWDDCCVDGGMLYAYVEQLNLTDGLGTAFPQQYLGKMACPAPASSATFVLGYARCLPVRAEGVPASVDQGYAMRVLAVAWAMWKGVKCCLIDWQADRPRITATMGLLQIVPDEGPCTGYELRVQVLVPDGCSC